MREREKEPRKGRGLPVCEHAARGGGSRPLHLRPVDTICVKLNKIGASGKHGKREREREREREQKFGKGRQTHICITYTTIDLC